jgi:hypothetical protein
MDLTPNLSRVPRAQRVVRRLERLVGHNWCDLKWDSTTGAAIVGTQPEVDELRAAMNAGDEKPTARTGGENWWNRGSRKLPLETKVLNRLFGVRSHLREDLVPKTMILGPSGNLCCCVFETAVGKCKARSLRVANPRNCLCNWIKDGKRAIAPPALAIPTALAGAALKLEPFINFTLAHLRGITRMTIHDVSFVPNSD